MMDEKELLQTIEKEGDLDLFFHRCLPCLIRRKTQANEITLDEGLRLTSQIHTIREEKGMNKDAPMRTRIFHLCGYVGVPKGHPAFGKGIDQCDNFLVHGGITYAGHMLPTKDFWFIGFDCAHWGDISMLLNLGTMVRHTYKDLEFVRGECKRLADGLAGLSPINMLHLLGAQEI